MRIAVLVLTIFAAAWASAGLLVSGATPVLVLIAIGVSLALLACGWRGSGLVRSAGSHVGKLIGFWSAIEGVAIFLTANMLENLHRDDLMFPAIVIIVGLHFFPLARGIPARSYYATGAGFIFTGLIGLLLPGGERPLVVGTCAALILWATSLLLILRAKRLTNGPRPSISDGIQPLR